MLIPPPDFLPVIIIVLSLRRYYFWKFQQSFNYRSLISFCMWFLFAARHPPIYHGCLAATQPKAFNAAFNVALGRIAFATISGSAW